MRNTTVTALLDNPRIGVLHLDRRGQILGPVFIVYTSPLLIIIDVAELILSLSLEAFVVAAAVCCLVEMLVV